MVPFKRAMVVSYMLSIIIATIAKVSIAQVNMKVGGSLWGKIWEEGLTDVGRKPNFNS